MRRPALRLLALLGVLAVVSGSCGGQSVDVSGATVTTAKGTGPGDGTQVSTTATTTIAFEIPGDLGDAPLVLPPVDRGVLVGQRWLSRDTASATWVDPQAATDGLSLTLAGCRVRYPGQWLFDVTLAAPAGIEFPITLGLGFGWGHGDLWTGAPPVEVDLAAAGAFSVEYDSAAYLRDHKDLVLDLETRQREEMAEQLLSDISGTPGIGWEGAGCELRVDYSPNAPVAETFTYLSGAVTEDLVSPEVTAAEGTVEYLAQTAGLADGPTPGRSWAQLYGHGWMPVAPVVWMEPDRAFSSLREHWTLGGRCYTLHLQYHHDGGDPYEVWQYRGCRSAGPVAGQPSAVLVLGDWTIVAAGEEQPVVDAAIGRLEPFFVTTTWPEPLVAVGETIGETTFDGAVIYLVRLDHGESGASIVLESTEMDLSTGPGSGANGEAFRGCWQTAVYQQARIALVLVGDPTWVVRVDGTPLHLQEAEGGIGYAVIEWTSRQPPIPTITDSQGSTPCS